MVSITNQFPFLSRSVRVASLCVAVGCGLIACREAPADCKPMADDKLVGNAGCLLLHDGKLMMVQQRSRDVWSVPGGTAEAGEAASCTATRETREETGLQVRAVAPVITLKNGFHLYHCVLEQNADASSLKPGDALEINQARWFDEAERDQVDWRYPKQKELINRLVDQLSGSF